MDFASISNINSYMKTLKMNNIWKQNADNPFKSVIQKSSNNKSEEEYKTASTFGDERLMSIKAKMQSGQKLSSDDMDYLRENDPATYDEVIKMEREKKEYAKELVRCKTKDDARMLHLGKVTNVLMAAKSGTVSAEVALAKLAKMTEAYQKFTESSHYSKLAANHMELAKAIEAEKEAITGKNESKPIQEESIESEAQITDKPPEQQAVDGDNDDIETHPVFKPQKPQPLPETSETQPTPKLVMQKTAYIYTSQGYAKPTIPHNYSHEGGSPRSGMDVDV